MRSPIVLLLLATLTACAAADNPESSEALETWTLAEELRVGSIDDPELALTYIGDVEAGPDGHLYVSQPMDARIKILDRDGNPVAEFGRKGGGPGEFERVGSMTWRSDTLWVLDPIQGRFSLFTPGGEFIRTISFVHSAGPSGRALRPSSLLPDGTIVAYASLPSRLIASGEITHSTFVRLDTAGGVIDTLAVVPLGNGHLSIEYERGAMYSSQPFGDAPITSVHPDTSFLILDRTVVAAERPHFTLTKLSFTGDTVFSRTYPYLPVPLEPGEADSIADAWVERMKDSRMVSGMGAAEARKRYREALYVPDHRVPVSTMHLGHDGSIWLRMTGTLPDTSRWLVLDPDGEPEAEVRLPTGVRPRWVGGGEVWATLTDELDVPYLVRYGITAAREVS